MDVAYATINLFSSLGYADPARDELSFGIDKPMAETAMLIYAASACRTHENIKTRINRIATKLGSCARTDEVALNIALHPSQAIKLSLPHILLSKLGYPDADFEKLVAVTIAEQERCGDDKTRSAIYESQWIANLRNKDSNLADQSLNARKSFLFSPVDLIGGRREDAYGFTHLMMYSTDFGFCPTDLNLDTGFAIDQASSLLAKCVGTEDYDLAGELLLTWPYLRAKWDPQSAFAYRLLTSIEGEVGHLPCANIDLRHLSTLDGKEHDRYALASSYHTIYVTGFLAAALLGPGMTPPDKIIGAGPSAPCIDRVMEHLDVSQAHWYPLFLSLSNSEKEALARFIFDLGISQACIARDYSRLAKILSLETDAELDDSLLSVQAKQLLSRLVECANLSEKVKREPVPPRSAIHPN